MSLVAGKSCSDVFGSCFGGVVFQTAPRCPKGDGGTGDAAETSDAGAECAEEEEGEDDEEEPAEHDPEQAESTPGANTAAKQHTAGVTVKTNADAAHTNATCRKCLCV